MDGEKMHSDELDTGAELVARLIAAQFPQWASLPVVKLPSAGTDHAMYRLADDMVVRLPRIPRAADQVETEQRWLPHLAPHLPLHVPVPLGRGVPGQGFPMPWSVHAWLDGENAFDRPIVDLHDAAIELGGFVAALRSVDATGGPQSYRGGPMSASDGEATRAAIRGLGAEGMIDAEAATAAWEQVLALPQWEGKPCWLHGDLMPGNLLTRDGRLTGVIDFGIVGIGDPACDLIPAWYLFSGDTRELFRAAADVDDSTWARGRGWALCLGLGSEHYYRIKNPALATVGRVAMSEALADCRSTG
ncbi:MAG: aminoglycoside phosphotransferase family protein [Actinomycetes bacterium]